MDKYLTRKSVGAAMIGLPLAGMFAALVAVMGAADSVLIVVLACTATATIVQGIKLWVGDD